MRALITACVAAAGLGACVNRTVEANPKSVLAEYGYQQQHPPVTTHGPGTLVHKIKTSIKDPAFVSLAYICNEDATRSSVPISISPTQSSTIAQKLNADFSLSGAEIANFGIGSSAKYVKNITLRFDNVEIQEYSTQALAEILETADKGCRTSLRRKIKIKNAYQVSSVIKADLSYNIEFDSEISAKAQEEALTQIGMQIGVNINQYKGTVGKGLYYGVYLEPQFSQQ